MAVQLKRALRTPLTRLRITTAALRYVDQHGIDSLSMHKLGAVLGVRAMSLYGHVADKDALLNGIVEVMWEEVEPPETQDWREMICTFARSLRALALRHPRAAPLLMSRPGFPVSALRISEIVLRELRAQGVPEKLAAPLLRTTIAYGFGSALSELSCLPGPPNPDEDEIGRIRRVSALLPSDVDDQLLRVGLLLCGDCRPADDFELGIDLMIRGLDAQL